jgi:hypothetical protein
MLLAVPAALAQDEGSARPVLDACIDSLESDVVGLEDMEAACPGLDAALEELGIKALLPVDQHHLLTPSGLANLRTLLDRYAQPPEGQVGVDSVHSVLESLREPVVAEQELSWFERLKRWLREAFDRQEEEANPWLQRWLNDHPISEAVRLALFYGVMLLVVLMAIVIVVNEVRAARTGRRKSGAATASAVDAGVVTSGEFDLEAALREGRPSAVLRLLIATLVKTGRLHGAQSLTHRELMARARFDDSTQRDSFRRVTQLAELEVFSGKALASDAQDEAVRVGRSLNAQLSGAAT